MGPNARFVGYRAGDDLADHYAAADLFAFASLTETFGNVVLEAMASGLPVVAVRAGRRRRHRPTGRDRLPGRAVRPPVAVRRGLLGLVDDAALRREMAESARAYALSQTWDAIMGGLRDRYLAVGRARGLGRRPAV